MSALAEVADAALEVSVVGSFSSLGFAARRHLFGWTEAAANVLAGRVALVTGASSGLGLAAADGLAALGARVVLLGRDEFRTGAARDAIAARTGQTDLQVVVADLSRLGDVRRAASEILSTNERLDVLVNNAGTLTHDFAFTDDGLELTAQTHVVAPFLLTSRLLSLLEGSNGRVITVTSGGMYSSGLDFDDLVSTDGDGYDGVKAYARAKRAQVILNRQWAERFPVSGVAFHAMHPGWADTEGVRSSLPGFHRLMRPILRSPAEGVDTTLWLASSDEAQRNSGELWLDRHRRRVTHFPGTATSAIEAAALWDWCVATSGADLSESARHRPTTSSPRSVS